MARATKAAAQLMLCTAASSLTTSQVITKLKKERATVLFQADPHLLPGPYRQASAVEVFPRPNAKCCVSPVVQMT